MNTLIQDMTKAIAAGFFNERDKAFMAALVEKGLPADEEFIKSNVQCIIRDGDEFEHYWYHFGQPDAIRIISFQREPKCELVQPDSPISNNWKQTVEAKYY